MSSPKARLSVQLGNDLVGDVFRPHAVQEPTSAILFHSSNGRREDLTQLAWAIAQRGFEATTVSWISEGVTAYPDAYERVRSYLARRVEGGPLAICTLGDSSLVLGTAIVQLAEAFTLGHSSLVTVGGVFGWHDDVPADVRESPRAQKFFGGDINESRGWYEGVPLGHADRWPTAVRVVSVTPVPLLAETIAFHSTLRSAGTDSLVLTYDGPLLLAVSPRHPEGRATVEQMAEALAV